MTSKFPRIQRWMENIFQVTADISWRITEPSVSTEPKQRRHIRLLSAFLILMTLNTLAGAVSLKNIGGNSWMVMIASSAALLAGYFVSRTRYYRAALILAIIIPAVPSLAIAAFKAPDIDLTIELMWLALPLLISSLMLTVRQTITLALSYIAFIIILEWFGSLGFEILAPLMAYLLIITFFVIAVAVIRRIDRSEIENQLAERFQVEKALRESEEKFRNLFECAKDVIVLADAQTGIIIDVNPAATKLLGLPKEKMVGKHQSILHPPEKVEKYKQVFRDHVEKGLVLTEDILLQRADGTLITADVSAGVFQLRGRPVIQGVFRNITERKQMEEALANEAIWRRILIKESRDGIVILDQNGKVYEANRRYAEMLGYSPEEMSQLHVWDWDTQWTPEQLLDMITTVDEAGDHFETYQQRKDGTVVDVEVSTNGATFAGQKLVFCVCRDITERKRMENALRESEEKFSKAFHASPDGISISTLSDGKFLEVNESYTRITGYTREELIGSSASDFNMWANDAQQERMLRKIRDGVKIHDEEFDFYAKSGELHTMLLSTEYVQIGGQSCVLVVNSDITERKQIEKALRESEEKFSAAFRSSPDLIAIVNLTTGYYIEVNESFARNTGFTREELIGHSIDELNMWVFPEEEEKMKRLMQEQGKITNEEFTFRMKSGELRQWLCSVEMLSVGGEPCFIAVAIDITERKQAEDKLKHAMVDLEHSTAQLQATNKELESFSYSVSHDLRSPLRSIDGFSQAMLEDYADKLDETGQDYLKRLRNASQKMGELIDGLLKLSRLTRSEIHREEMDLSLLADEIAARLKESYPKRRVKFTIGSGLTANGDPQMLRVLLENLLGNALKFTLKTPRARIEFGSTANGEKKTFFIKDNGAGFDMAYIDKLFGAFQRLHDTTDFPGTGIGLATVQRIVNRHGGNIRAEGAIGKGATFYFTLD